MSHHHAPHSPDSQGHSHESDHGHPDASHPGHHHGHHHSHHHGHHHGHHHPSPSSYTRAFTVGLVLNAGFVLVEFSFGLKAGSIALIADAGHNLSDVMGLILAWGAWLLARRRPTADKTYGWRKSSILAAFLNAGFLLIVTGGITWEAVGRLLHPSPVEGSTLIWVAAIGILINTLTALMFLAGRQTDLNIRAAFMHMAADALVSLGVVLAGIVLLFTQWLWLDPAFSLVISSVIIVGTWSLLAESFHMAVDGVPSGIDGQAVRLYLMERPGVTQVHDLHIWGMSTTETALTAHLVMPQVHPGDGFLAQVCQDLRDHFGIDHTTLQIETGDPRYPCLLEPIERV